MPRPRNTIPTYRLHRQSGQPVVTVRTADGGRKDVLLGPHGSPESKAEYERVIAHLRVAAPAAPVRRGGASVNEVLLGFLNYLPTYYRRPDGSPTGEVKEFRYACRHLRTTCGHEPAAEFGPAKLKQVRDSMVAAGWCRNRVNKQVRRVRLVFAWAAEEEMIPAAVAVGLRLVRGLGKNRSAARETDDVPPAPPADVARAMLFMVPTLRAMVGLQRLTGMRPGEVRSLTPAEVDTSGPLWVYRPGSVRPGGHKTAHLDRDRAVVLGPKARAILEPWLAAADGPAALLFTPKRAKAEQLAARRAARKSKVTPSQVCRKKPEGEMKKKWRDSFTDFGYAHAVERACVRAGVPPFAPNQVRRLFATEVRARYGLEAAQVLLGHAKADVTQVYAERDLTLALKVAAEVG